MSKFRNPLSFLETDPKVYSIVCGSLDNSSSRTDAMHPMPQSNAVDLKYPKSFLLGTSALVCFALAAPVMADDFTIASGTSTNDGYTIDGGDTVTLTGALTITGAKEGIETTGGTNTVIVSKTGSITTGTDQYSYGIDTDGDGNTITVSGNIKSEGDDGYGITNRGDFNTTTVSGSITTGGVDSTGIWNRRHNNTTTLTSTGVITVNGAKTDGIFISGNKNITIVHGSIFVNGNGVSTSGDKSSGIFNEGDDNKTILSGSIKTTGDYLGGIYNYGDSGDHTVSGSITTDGTEAYGIVNSGDCVSDCNTNTNMTSISGTVKSTGTRSAALYNKSGSGNSFTLNEGATIIGDILARGYDVDVVAATNSKLIFNLGASTSYAYSVSGMGSGTGAGQWTFSDLDGRTQGVTTTGKGCDTTVTTITVCNLVTGVSTGNVEAQDELQFSMNSSMIGSLEFGSGQADAPAEAMSFTQSSKSNTWTNVYGGTSKRASSTTKLAFDTSNRGLTIGTPVSINDTLDVDLVFNVSRTSLDIGLTKDQEITSNSYNLGAVLRDLAPSTGWAVDAFGFIGRNSYDGTRKVMNNQEATGSETVTAAYSGSEVLVGVDAQYSNPVTDTLNFIGGVNASFSNEKIGAYSESKYFSWDARTMTQASGGITAGLEHSKDALTTFASVGLQGSSLRSGKTATYTNNGTAGSFTDNSRGSIYRSVTVGFDYAGSESMTLSGALEGFSSTGGVSGNSASLTANWSF